MYLYDDNRTITTMNGVKVAESHKRSNFSLPNGAPRSMFSMLPLLSKRTGGLRLRPSLFIDLYGLSDDISTLGISISTQNQRRNSKERHNNEQNHGSSTKKKLHDPTSSFLDTDDVFSATCWGYSH